MTPAKYKTFPMARSPVSKNMATPRTEKARPNAVRPIPIFRTSLIANGADMVVHAGLVQEKYESSSSLAGPDGIVGCSADWGVHVVLDYFLNARGCSGIRIRVANMTKTKTD